MFAWPVSVQILCAVFSFAVEPFFDRVTGVLFLPIAHESVPFWAPEEVGRLRPAPLLSESQQTFLSGLVVVLRGVVGPGGWERERGREQGGVGWERVEWVVK